MFSARRSLRHKGRENNARITQERRSKLLCVTEFERCPANEVERSQQLVTQLPRNEPAVHPNDHFTPPAFHGLEGLHSYDRSPPAMVQPGASLTTSARARLRTEQLQILRGRLLGPLRGDTICWACSREHRATDPSSGGRPSERVKEGHGEKLPESEGS